MKSIMPSEIKGKVNAPSSKSMMARAVAASLLVEGITTILKPSFCDDGLAAMGIAETLGARLNRIKAKVTVGSAGIFKNIPESNVLDCGESGLCMRMFAPIVSLLDEKFTLDAKGSLLKRPMKSLEELSQLGAECKTSAGYPRVSVKGPIRGGRMDIDGSETSQFLSGLLMALPLCKEDSVIRVENLKSKPYVEMTLSLLRHFGIEIANENYEIFRIKGNQKYKNAALYTVEGDWSGASFMLVAGAIAGKIRVENLRNDSPQADKAVIEALEKAGAKVKAEKDAVEVEKSELNGFEFDATHCPDLFPPLVALACNCEGKTLIKGTKRLEDKESNRAKALLEEFTKIGAKITVEGNIMRITGTKLKGGEVDSHNDHRIAMACAVAGLNSEKEVKINNENCVSKSYPGFFKDLEKVIA